MEVYIKYFEPDLIPLKKLAEGDWIDLRAAEDVEMKAGEFRIVLNRYKSYFLFCCFFDSLWWLILFLFFPFPLLHHYHYQGMMYHIIQK